MTHVILSQRRSAAAPAVSPSAFLSICLSVSLDGRAPRRTRAQCVLGAVLRQRWPCDCLTRQDHPHMGAVHRLLYFHAFGTLGLGPQGTDQRLRGIHGQCLERSGTVSRVECCCTSCAVERGTLPPPPSSFLVPSIACALYMQMFMAHCQVLTAGPSPFYLPTATVSARVEHEDT